MAAEKLSQAKKRKTGDPEDQPAKRRKEHDSSSSSIDDNEEVAGKIKRIFMKNFMCHDSMEVNFNPMINFIVGANGSGKSAILTALTVGLGARASVTQRGPSIKEFIKKGKASALIEITVTNDGSSAYKFETYGSSITIVRTIGASSSYKIKNWRGEVISTRKEELENIVSSLNIQVDNPVSVLNQDVSRSFLTNAGPSEKYKLFMKATRLETIGINYKNAHAAAEAAKLRLNENQKILSENEKEIKKLQKKLKAVESLDRVKEEYEQLQNELLWSTVIQEEKQLLQIETEIKEQEKSIDKFKNDELAKTAKEKEIDAKIKDLEEEIKEAEAEASDGTNKVNELRKKYAEDKKIVNEKRGVIKELHSTIKRHEDNIVALQDAIKKAEAENSTGSRKQEAMENKARYEQELDEVRAILRTKQTDRMHLEEDKRRHEKDEYQLRIDYNQKNSDLTRLKKQLAAVQRESSDALAVYGSNMPRLLRRIEEDYKKGKFREMPLGPLGSFIRSKDPTWIPAIENHLGFGVLTSFCVDNAQDGRVLDFIIKEIFQGERTRPQIVISKFFPHVHDVSNGCTNSPRYMNLLDVLEISHPVIANSLIDQREIECILLIPTSDEACSIMSDASKVPQNCRRAITKQADLFYPDPHYRTYGGSVTRPKFLQVSTTEAIQSLQEEIEIKEAECQQLHQELINFNKKTKNNKLELQEVQQLVTKLTAKENQLKISIEEVKEIIDSCNNVTLNAFLTELEELQSLVVQKKEEESHLMEELREFQKNLDNLGTELTRYRDIAQNLESKLTPIKEKIKELHDERKRLNVFNQGAARRVEEGKQALQKLNGKHQQQQRVVNSKLEIAEKACPRISTRKTFEEINSKLKELKVTITTVEKQHGSKDALREELNEKQTKYSSIRDKVVALTRNVDRHIERLIERKSFFDKMKKQMTQLIEQSFKFVLSFRNYKGKIMIDHVERVLNLEVSPANDAKRPTNDSKALSGGERSYSTIAFILALWDVVGLPFYFLDEFDVFMDKINRRIIMDLLLAHAKAKPQCQYAFLTPLDTHIEGDNSITIHRLAPPERPT